jgi:voltage-gated potassium channel
VTTRWSEIFRARYASLVAGYFILLLVGGLLPETATKTLVLVLILTALVLSALYGIAQTKRERVQATLYAALLLVALWVEFALDRFSSSILVNVAAFLFMAHVARRILVDVLSSKRVTADTLFGAFAVYFTVGMAFAAVYDALEILAPGSFAGDLDAVGHGLEDSVYFSFVTLTTLGYGDVTPVSQAARTFTVIEALTGVSFTTILLARLVAIYSGTPIPEDDGDDS